MCRKESRRPLTSYDPSLPTGGGAGLLLMVEPRLCSCNSTNTLDGNVKKPQTEPDVWTSSWTRSYMLKDHYNANLLPLENISRRRGRIQQINDVRRQRQPDACPLRVLEDVHGQLPDLGPLVQGLGHFSQQQAHQEVVPAVLLRQAELQALLCGWARQEAELNPVGSDLDEMGQAQVDAARLLQDLHVADGDVGHDGQHQRLQRLEFDKFCRVALRRRPHQLAVLEEVVEMQASRSNPLEHRKAPALGLLGLLGLGPQDTQHHKTGPHAPNGRGVFPAHSPRDSTPSRLLPPALLLDSQLTW
ncbi:hypothetical protein EYF80_043480 [Liparis tanakae]|uniref:Uncharacterized protein n=1 Tax=Liparis tanakae TaxID=230148 RepID=A0A4Z2FZC5_9TELE|nr:hypothetical protein EYF80_043480 [Liparis tanakae]